MDLYENGQLIKFIEQGKENEILFSGSEIEPKYNLLKANVIGKLDGASKWIEELNKFQKNILKLTKQNMQLKLSKNQKKLN